LAVVLVKYFADIRIVTGRGEQQWTKAAPTVRALASELVSEYGTAFEKKVFHEGHLSGSIIILVNGRDVTLRNGLETPLSPEDTVVFFPMVAGG
jgi:MoaD family protein